MPGQVELFLWYASIALPAVLLWQFHRHRLVSRYPVIFSLLLAQCIRSLWLTQFVISPDIFQRKLNYYGLTILFTEPVLIAGRAAAVFELCSHVLQSYRGLSFLSRMTLLAALGASTTVSLLLHWPEFSFSGEPYRYLRMVYLMETTVYSSLLVFLLLLALFVLYHPAPLKRNLLAHGIGYGAYMLSSAAAVWLRNQDATQWTRAASTLRLGVAMAGLAAWAWLLSPQGEEETVDVHVPLSPATERRVLARLEVLNSAMGRN